MVGLDEVKAIIDRVEPAVCAGAFMEIDSAAVFEEGWEHLGDDYFYNESREQVAGPAFGRATRSLAWLTVIETIQHDLEEEWDRQAGIVPILNLETNIEPGLIAARCALGSAPGKCGCSG